MLNFGWWFMYGRPFSSVPAPRKRKQPGTFLANQEKSSEAEVPGPQKTSSPMTFWPASKAMSQS